jgi:hypothetical protein
MLPPQQEGVHAISNQNGKNPSAPIPENSIEYIVIEEKNPQTLKMFLRNLLVECSSKLSLPSSEVDFPQSTQIEDRNSFTYKLQKGFINIFSEAIYFMKRRSTDKLFIAVKEEYLKRVIDFYTSEIFLSDFSVNKSELNPQILGLVEARLREIKKNKTFDDLKFDYTNRRKLPDFIRYAFSSKVDSTLSIIANQILDILNQSVWRNNTRTDLLIELQYGVNQLGDHIYRVRFEAWKKSSPRVD